MRRVINQAAQTPRRNSLPSLPSLTQRGASTSVLPGIDARATPAPTPPNSPVDGRPPAAALPAPVSASGFFAANQRAHSGTHLQERRFSATDLVRPQGRLFPPFRGIHSTSVLEAAPFEKIAKMYGVSGELKDYANAKVGLSSSAIKWAEDQGQLPEHVDSIVDIGTAQGAAAIRLGQKYPEASILGLDTDPGSAKFIEEKISSGTGLGNRTKLDNPERVQGFTGTLKDALESGTCKKNSVGLVNMDGVAPYMDNDQLRDALKDIHDAMAPGGKLILTCYGEDHYYKADTGKASLTLRTDLTMLNMLREAGFEPDCISNTLLTDKGKSFEKNITDMNQMGKRDAAMPDHPQDDYWHTIKIAATKNML